MKKERKVYEVPELKVYKLRCKPLMLTGSDDLKPGEASGEGPLVGGED